MNQELRLGRACDFEAERRNEVKEKGNNPLESLETRIGRTGWKRRQKRGNLSKVRGGRGEFPNKAGEGRRRNDLTLSGI